MAKDLFSVRAADYAAYRPTYPPELFEFILQFVVNRNRAWDCATGNGQAAAMLATHFEQVKATDISQAQLDKAVRKPNIEYILCPAEQTPFPDNSFDLITIATAYHWLQWVPFAREAKRVSKAGAVVAAWAYNLVATEDEEVNRLLHHFYYDIVGPYWDPERKHVEDSYSRVSFPFAPLPVRDFEISRQWTRDHFKGYLGTWSAVGNYLEKNKTSPLLLIREELDRLWQKDEVKTVRFPLFLKLGRMDK